MLTLVIALLSPSPAPNSAPLKTIMTIQSRAMCAQLRQQIGPAIGGLLANDHLASEGQVLLGRITGDSINEVADDEGGAGAKVSMDNLKIENIVGGMVANIARLEKMLSVSGATPPPGSQDAEMIVLARERLTSVIAAQKAELNVLSYVWDSNAGRDLQFKKDPTGGAHGNAPLSELPQTPPVALPQSLWLDRQRTRVLEGQASRVVNEMISSCK